MLCLSLLALPKPVWTCQSLKESVWPLFVASCLLTSFATPARASVVFLPSTDEVKLVSDGESGVFVEYGVAKIYKLWSDNDAKNLSGGEDNSGKVDIVSLWISDAEMGPLTSKIVMKLRDWREMSTQKQRGFILKSSRTNWDKDMFVTMNSPRRYPLETPASTQVNTEPQRDSYGCLPGEQFYEYKGFLGIGREKLGCMTPEQAAALHQQRSQAWRNVNTQNQINQMQYQQQQTQFQNQQQQYRMGQQLYYQQQQLNRLRNGY